VEKFGPQLDPTRDPLNDILKAIAHVSITNNFPSLPELYVHLDSLALPSSERVRPGWDDYFMVSPASALHAATQYGGSYWHRLLRLGVTA
jgi:hypothetical protein